MTGDSLLATSIAHRASVAAKVRFPAKHAERRVNPDGEFAPVGSNRQHDRL